MATTQLSDIYNPLVFEAAVDEAAAELNAFLQSGVMVESPKLSNMASVGGNIGELPFHSPLATATEPDYVDDDPAHTSTPAKIGTAKMIYRLASMHYSWSTMDLTRELALMDPLAAIVQKIGGWWATQKEKRVIQSAMGVLADNIANDSGDMANVIYSDLASPADSNIISAEAVIDTQQTSGDHQGVFTAIAMHSVTYSNLKKQNLIDFIPNASGAVVIPTYLELRVVVDDSLPVTAGSNSPAYTTILFSTGAFDHGKGNTMKPSELERVAGAGYGGGQDIVHSRSADIIHPYGFQFVSASIVGQSATLAELAEAVEWDRVVARKQVGMAFLKHNN